MKYLLLLDFRCFLEIFIILIQRLKLTIWTYLKNTYSEQVLKDNELKLPHFLQKLNIPQTTYLLSFWRKSNILKYIFQPRAYNLTKKLSIGIFKCHYLHSNPTYQLQMNIYLRIIHLQHTQTFSDDLLFLYQRGMLVYREILRTYYMNDPLFI